MLLRLKLLGILIGLTCCYFQVSSQTLSLIPSNYNGYNVSCFGGRNGSIDLTITGGTPPYNIRWSTNEGTEDISSLSAGYYRVEVYDADTLTGIVFTDITLTEPMSLQLGGTIHTYSNGYNISLYDACNGIVNPTVSGGISPYNWLWNDKVFQLWKHHNHQGI